ncbi:DUF1615 family protein [Alkanindiges sp. WGS2144]|uniref:DUF1615 family protein n=1 Tax=Alkanindiges sp. WGS2144 TaxID=3366808 RepID=UPI0037505E1E
MPIRPILTLALSATVLSACQSSSENTENSSHRLLESKHIYRLIPSATTNRMAWANDIRSIMDDLNIERNLDNSCAIIAVVDQESNFIADPQVAELGKKSVREMNERLTKKLGKKMTGYFNDMLAKQPSPDDNFLMQLEQVKTERELDLLYRQIFDFYTRQYKVNLVTSAARIIARQDIEETFNPVSTLGSMQVHIRYARDHSRSGGNLHKIRDDLYTQYGGLYYGIHRLMTYPASYEKPIYRFADYNSGIYSSRNAAFQQMINQLTKQKLSLDGDLLSYDKEGDVLAEPTDSEQALIQLFLDKNISLDAKAIRHDLKKEKQQELEDTKTYQQVLSLYKEKFKTQGSYAVMPEVVISGPKLRRDYNTNWYASRVNQRYRRCVNHGKKMGFKMDTSKRT